MKISYIAPGLGACALLMFASCRSTDGEKYTESALPMSEVADGEIPPWLLEDDGTNGAQVGAGTHTPTVAANRNDYSIPEPDAAPARTSSRQNQPDLAEQDNTYIEPGIDPLAGTPIPTASGSTTASAQASTTSGRTSGSTSTGRKPGKKPKQPTLIVYKVRPGDNLSVIASRSNTTVAQIMRDSNLSGTTIYPGQTIKVRYTPKGYKESNSNKGKKGSSTSGRTHTVTAGQTLSGIAAKYGVSTSALMRANGLTNADARKIRPGQKLRIPKR